MSAPPPLQCPTISLTMIYLVLSTELWVDVSHLLICNDQVARILDRALYLVHLSCILLIYTSTQANTSQNVNYLLNWGVFQLENGHFTHSQRSESHPRPRSHFATLMMVLYRKWENDLGTKWPNWNTYFARNYCKVIARKGLKFLALQRIPTIGTIKTILLLIMLLIMPTMPKKDILTNLKQCRTFSIYRSGS